MTIITMEELANAYQELDRLNEAITLGEQALTNSVKVLGPQNPQTLVLHGQSGRFLLPGRSPG